jgi:hypothetical protein
MACSTCQSTNTSCGCKDIPLTTAPVYSCPPDIKCPDPTPCYETIQDTCVKHGNYSIINFGSLLASGDSYPALPAGASLENAYQAMSVGGWDNDNCLPVINVHPSYIGTTAIIVSWEDTGADTYTIGISDNGTFFSNTTGLTTTSYTFTLLNSNTNYYFKVYTNCDGNESTGATIMVKTLPAL